MAGFSKDFVQKNKNENGKLTVKEIIPEFQKEKLLAKLYKKEDGKPYFITLDFSAENKIQEFEFSDEIKIL